MSSPGDYVPVRVGPAFGIAPCGELWAKELGGVAPDVKYVRVPIIHFADPPYQIHSRLRASSPALTANTVTLRYIEIRCFHSQATPRPAVYHPIPRCLPPHAPLCTTPCPAVYHPMPRCLPPHARCPPPHAPLSNALCPAVEILSRTLCPTHQYLALGGGCSLQSRR